MTMHPLQRSLHLINTVVKTPLQCIRASTWMGKKINNSLNYSNLSQRHYSAKANLRKVEETEGRMSTMDSIIDLRSDTLTKPTLEMRQAMATAEVGDDVYGEDPTIIEVQDRCAELFGMEATLFVPTGTMGNLISILVHCQERGLEAIVGHKSHILLNEQGGIAQFAGVCPRTIPNLPDGTFDLEELRSLIRPRNDPHQPWTKLICLENTHNFCGGRALPLEFVKKVYKIAQENNLIVHTDGARILNAAAALGVPVSDILKYSDSVSLCFSKGLACPVGSIIGGKKDFIEKATRMRKVLGGGLRQGGILAAAALYSLDNIVPRLGEDHKHAQMIAQAMMSVSNGVVDIDVHGVDTNIITVQVVKPGLTAADFCDRVKQVPEEEEKQLGGKIVLKMNPIYPQTARILTHNDLSADMIQLAIKKLQYVIMEYNSADGS